MTEPDRDPAMLRFLMLQLVRVVGVLLWQSGSLGASDPTTGKALFAAGLFLTLVVPAVLRRRWRTPRP